MWWLCAPQPTTSWCTRQYQLVLNNVDPSVTQLKFSSLKPVRPKVCMARNELSSKSVRPHINCADILSSSRNLVIINANRLDSSQAYPELLTVRVDSIFGPSLLLNRAYFRWKWNVFVFSCQAWRPHRHYSYPAQEVTEVVAGVLSNDSPHTLPAP